MQELKQKEMPNIEERNKIRELAGNIETLAGKSQDISMEEADTLLEQRLKIVLEKSKETPMEKKLMQNFERVEEQQEFSEELKKCNPNFELGNQWKINCQRCVPTYEMRRRGYDVTASPKPDKVEQTDLSYNPFSVWKDPEIIRCSGNGLMDIEKNMEKWGDGSRAQIVVVWKNTNSGHTFCAERINGKTVFYDPQNGASEVSKYFQYIEPGSVSFCRIDNKDVTEKILDCCRKVG